MSDNQPIACDFTAIDKGERETHKQNAGEVFKSVEECLELSDGYAFRIPTDTGMVEKTGAFVARERLCCPFFKFNLELSPDEGPVWLKLTGNEEVKQFIRQNVIPQFDLEKNED